MKKCPYCGHQFGDDVNLCPTDGYQLVFAYTPIAAAVGCASKPTPEDDSIESLPLEIRCKSWLASRKAILITKEGICYSGQDQGFSLSWREVESMALSETTSYGGVIARKIAANITLVPFWPGTVQNMDVLGLERTPRAIMMMINRARWAFGRQCPPPIPSAAPFPVSISLHKDISPLALLAFLGLFCLPIFFWFVGGNRSPFDPTPLLFFSPALLAGLIPLLFWLRRQLDRKPKLLLTSEGLTSTRLANKWFVPWDQITEVDLFSLRLKTRDRVKPLRVPTRGLDMPSLDIARLITLATRLTSAKAWPSGPETPSAPTSPGSPPGLHPAPIANLTP